MKVCVLGAGNVGLLIAKDLSQDYEVSIADRSQERLKLAADFATPIELDASNFERLVDCMKKFDLIVGALPGRFGYNVLKAALKAQRDIVDVSFMPEDPLQLDEDAKTAKIRMVVDAGFAPGLSNVLMGHIQSELGLIEEGWINVGGLPKDPKPPLYYRVVFSPYDLIEEYTRPARIIKNGEIVSVDPLGTINEILLKNFQFESFVSDGLRTLLKTINANNLVENTLRWKGHLEKIKVLRELGFFKKENIDFTMRVILPLMSFESDDFSIMEVYGRNDEEELRYFMYDEAQGGFTSMARATGYVTAICTRILAEHDFEPGVIPPELFGMEGALFKEIIKEVRKRGILLEEHQRGL
ncbi:MAG: saccharopine dehydrogenase NADP-binding domain-containing protein [Thermococcus sp.]|nr:saccharopine dehydrogenase NADP-binding domain-containing protein [Thermococcus sp.]